MNTRSKSKKAASLNITDSNSKNNALINGNSNKNNKNTKMNANYHNTFNINNMYFTNNSVLSSNNNSDIEMRDSTSPRNNCREKPDFTKCTKLTNWKEISIGELYSNLIKLSNNETINEKEEEEICCICRCALYDDLNVKTKEEIEDIENKMNNQEIFIDVVRMKDCVDHYFHKECLNNLLGTKSYLKCPICCDQPKGRMYFTIYKKGVLPCEGYPEYGTIEFGYEFPSGFLSNGTRYNGTSRVAYLPDNKEGRDVFELMQIGFHRGITFSVGTSVTTGRKNTVIWNIHHKTALGGGTIFYGYPDPTYFERVKLEWADKGVFNTRYTENLEN